MTFVCSKTDDISVMEAQDSLGIEEEMSISWKEMDAYSKKQKDLKDGLDDVKRSLKAYDDTVADFDEQLELWEPLLDSVEEGKAVYAPLQSKKRKSSGFERKRKRRKLSSDDEGDHDDEGITSDESDEELGRESPLTKESVVAKLAELRNTKKHARRQKTELNAQIKELKDSIAKAKEAEKNIEAEMQRKCISGRYVSPLWRFSLAEVKPSL